MTEIKTPAEKTLTVTPTKTLTLKRGVEQGVVRQSFSHGRTKAVVVEKLKRRVLGPGDGKSAESAAAGAVARRGAVAPTGKAPSTGIGVPLGAPVPGAK